MPHRIIDDPIVEFYGELMGTTEVPASNATGNNITAVPIRRMFKEILVEPQATQEARLHLTPAIHEIWYYDDSERSWLDVLSTDRNIIDRHTTGLVAVPALATADFLYIGAADRFRGVVLDLTGLNNNAATITVDYSRRGGFANDGNITDGTATGGAMLGVDGNITTSSVPTDWAAIGLDKIAPSGAPSRALHWWRISASALLDAITIVSIVTLHQDQGAGTTDGGAAFLKADTEYTFDIGDHVGGLEMISQTTTATTIKVTWIRRGG